MNYKDLCRLFKKPDYSPTKFVCMACETVVHFDEHIRCPACDRQIEWCCVTKRNGSYKVRL